ncbi:DUF6612 family protein [Sporosarcina sp. Te-1]|uniref:DUF6612 family protein n=1 Tax=Sporosarcina sp. Te-1 TaxID=2818390 RepID=UPI001A9E3C8C|nr:DUF6612 family protein [Sporosarcina sp. Te-1]QTD41748.1 hypothetical protein J3U78_02520 [Sporosarcina sp. Te-1]
MRKLATWALAFVFILSFALPQNMASAAGTVKLVVDGVEVEGYEQAFMSHGDVLIPIENLFTEAGYKVSKDKSGKVSVTNTYLTVDFNASAGSIEVNGTKADTTFPLTLKNYGNYVSGEFLSTLEGFEVEVSEDEQTVSVTTNRVKDLDKFLEKMMTADLKSYSAKMKLDQKMESSEEPNSISMIMDMDMDITQEPMAIHMKQKMTSDIGGEKEDFTTESYMTEEEFYQYDGDKWINYGSDFGLGLDAGTALDPTAQLEMAKMFMKGVHVFEYDDVYIMVQTLTTEDLNELMGEALSLIGTTLGGMDIPLEEISSETKAEEAVEVTAEESKEEATEEAVTVEENKETTEENEPAKEDAKASEATKETVTAEENKETTKENEPTTEESVLEGDFSLDALGLEIEEMYFVTTIDKKTLFPQDTKGTTKISMTIDDVTVKIVQTVTGTMSNFNAVKAIVIPEEVKKNAISLEDYMKELEAELETELKAAE